MTNITRNMGASFRRITSWLGPTRTTIIFFLLAFTGLGSLILNAVIAGAKGTNTQWATAVQSFLFVIFLVGAAVTVLSRTRPEDRRQIMLIVAPAIMAVAIGLFVPPLLPFFAPVGIGWLLVATMVVRGRVRREYQDAIKFLRKGEYDKAIKVMNAVIEKEPEKTEHYHFRATMFRLWGKIKRARADYEKVIQLDPESGVGYNGLAEVYLQDGEYQQALAYAKQALEHEPDQWVAPYNLGMIEDRLQLWEDSATHLQRALQVGIPDSRHRLLTHLWMARSYVHTSGNTEAEIAELKREKAGLKEWQTIFESDGAEVLRDVMQDDVALAEKLIAGQVTADALK